MEITRLYNTYRVAAFPWQPRANIWTLTVLCKTTFRLAPGPAVELPEAEALPIHEKDIYADALNRSLYAPSDLVPVKAKADILVVGNAYAPRDKPASHLMLSIVVGHFSKAIQVFGKRRWLDKQRLSDAAPFSELPLSYAYAAEGPDNPIGIPVGDLRAPSYMPVASILRSQGDKVAAAGFGPIAPTWPERLEKNATGQHAWSLEFWRKYPFPERLQREFFNAAPSDQQVALGALHPGAPLVLAHLHPEHETLGSSLPLTAPSVRVEQSNGQIAHAPMHGDTLWIDTAKSVATLTFRGSFSIEHPDRITRILIKGERAGPSLPRGALHTIPVSSATLNVGAATAPPLPFAASAEPSAYAMASSRSDPAAKGAWTGETVRVEHEIRPGPAHPFTTPSVSTATQLDDEDVLPASEELPTTRPPLPDRPAEPAMQAPPASPVIEHISTTEASSISTVPRVGRIAELKRLNKLPRAGPDAAQASDAAAMKDSPGPAPGEVRNAPGVAMPLPLETNPMDVRIRVLWSDRSLAENLQKQSPWREILAELVKEAAASGALAEGKEVKLLPKVLTRFRPLEYDRIRSTLEAAVDEDGSFSAPVVLLDGQLEMQFDDYEALRATLAVIAPLSLQDPKLKDLSAQVEQRMGKAEVRSSGAILRALAQQLMTAVQGKKDAPLPALETQRDQILIEGQHYQRRNILGQSYLRLHFRFPGQSLKEAWPFYIDPAVAKDLPLMQSLRVRALAELWTGLSQFDSAGGGCAFRALALSQVLERF